ncbi:hypothetical protein [Legionella sainthelensi]|uniref:hypothetical protein n=1 Tax=Legionella sainthelensi TaxID=28087 RepID=UPI001359A134|nr:hypothetical protein [Legionella sainthelensi]
MALEIIARVGSVAVGTVLITLKKVCNREPQNTLVMGLGLISADFRQSNMKKLSLIRRK